MSEEDMRCAARKLAERYGVDVVDDLVTELDHLKTKHAANLGSVALSPRVIKQSSYLENPYVVSKCHRYAANLLHAASYCCSSRTFFQHAGKSEERAEVNDVSNSAEQFGNFGSGGPSRKNS